MMIRKAKINELDEIMNMYTSCVDGMQKANIDQWDSTYPNRDKKGMHKLRRDFHNEIMKTIFG